MSLLPLIFSCGVFDTVDVLHPHSLEPVLSSPIPGQRQSLRISVVETDFVDHFLLAVAEYCYDVPYATLVDIQRSEHDQKLNLKMTGHFVGRRFAGPFRGLQTLRPTSAFDFPRVAASNVAQLLVVQASTRKVLLGLRKFPQHARCLKTVFEWAPSHVFVGGDGAYLGRFEIEKGVLLKTMDLDLSRDVGGNLGVAGGRVLCLDADVDRDILFSGRALRQGWRGTDSFLPVHLHSNVTGRRIGALALEKQKLLQDLCFCDETGVLAVRTHSSVELFDVRRFENSFQVIENIESVPYDLGFVRLFPNGRSALINEPQCLKVIELSKGGVLSKSSSKQGTEQFSDAVIVCDERERANSRDCLLSFHDRTELAKSLCSFALIAVAGGIVLFASAAFVED